MAKTYDSLTDHLQEWILQQHLFFVATAPLSAEGHVNLSPKGLNSLRILNTNTVAYLDITGSGNETSAHIMENGRVTFMWLVLEGERNMVGAYGHGEVILPDTARWDELISQFEMLPGARQIIVNRITKVITSCGYGVPIFEYQEERDTAQRWAENKGEQGLIDYRREKNMQSLDGLPTPLCIVNKL